MTIQDDQAFKAALNELDASGQRDLGLRFIREALPLVRDEAARQAIARLSDEANVTGDPADARNAAMTTAIDCHTRCGANADWGRQAAYFVARALVAALSEREPGGSSPAWQAAMAARMAYTCDAIDAESGSAENGQARQYEILHDYQRQT